MQYTSKILPKSIVLAFAVLPVYFTFAAFLLGDPENGAVLHAAKCTGCHSNMHEGQPEQIYLRENHKIKTIEGLIGQIRSCNEQVNANLSDDDVNDVNIYLNESYYKF